jgi:hypothetical protein
MSAFRAGCRRFFFFAEQLAEAAWVHLDVNGRAALTFVNTWRIRMAGTSFIVKPVRSSNVANSHLMISKSRSSQHSRSTLGIDVSGCRRGETRASR